MANWRGNWDSGTAYGVDDSVAYGGVFYVCTAPNTGQAPGSDVDWDPMDTFTGAGEPGEPGSGEGASTAFAPVRI